MSTQSSASSAARRIAVCVALAAGLTVFPAIASDAQKSPIADHSRDLYSGVGQILVRTAELMPEEHYDFRPVESVRTFGQIVGHVADAQYYFCSTVLGERNPRPGIEKTKSTKGELLSALRDAIAYCGRAYASVDDTSGAATVTFMGGDKPKLGVLTVNQVHSIEHYGNLVTYLRIKGIVPPTSDPDFLKKLAAN